MSQSYIIDLHVHTDESSFCANVPAKEMVKLYHDKGYNGVVVSDHYHNWFLDQKPELSWKEKVDNYLNGYRNAKEEAKKYDFDVFLGIEYKSNDDPNDYVVIGLTEDFLYENESLYNLPPYEALTIFKNFGAFIIQAHPMRPGNFYLADRSYIDAIEIHNGNSRQQYNAKAAIEAANEHNLIGVSGSDFHIIEDLAQGGVILNSRPNNSKELIELLKTGIVKTLDYTNLL